MKEKVDQKAEVGAGVEANHREIKREERRVKSMKKKEMVI